MVSARIVGGAVVVVLLVVAIVAFASLRPGAVAPASTKTTSTLLTTIARSSQTTTSTSATEATTTLTTGVKSTSQSTTVAGTTATTMAQTTTSSATEAAYAKGFSFSPATYDANGIRDFLAKAAMGGTVLEWAGDWQELGVPGGAPAAIVQLAAQNGLTPLIVVQFFSQSTGLLLRPLNSTNEAHYLSIASSFAGQYKPAYMGIGIEVNILHEKNATAFDQFVSLYGQVYDQIKAASPSTKVFTIFQLEMMNGLDGGLYGGTNNANQSEWQLLSLFPKDDVAAFTTYPSLIYQDPADIPSDYYSGITTHTNLTVGFTEVGWHTGYIASGWESNETEQANFIKMFFGSTATLNRSFVVWSFLYDPNAVVPFNTMGLFYVNGTAKLGWQTWLSAP